MRSYDNLDDKTAKEADKTFKEGHASVSVYETIQNYFFKENCFSGVMYFLVCHNVFF